MSWRWQYEAPPRLPQPYLITPISLKITMTPFLQIVARHLYAEIKNNSEGLTIIFPNKRAGLFFNNYLRQELDNYVWAPKYVTIDEVWRQLSTKQVADPIELVCRLYRVYLKQTGRQESLDHFYSWGETMCRDFDDIDNSMAHAEKLLGNVQELEDLKDFEFLSENQREALKLYFDHYMVKSDTELKQKFSAIWHHLYPIYQQFREALAEEGLAYMGMLKREVVNTLEACGAGEVPTYFQGRRFVVVGFNVLSPTEQRLFLAMKRMAPTSFYWDYDRGYTNLGEGNDNHSVYEAGQFIKENIRLFGNALDALTEEEQAEAYDNFSKPKQITYVSTATESQQTRYVAGWLKQVVSEKDDLIKTAVVLCNERNLQPLLHGIPDKYGDDNQMLLNITMGYPLGETPMVSFLLALAELQLFGRSGNNWRYQYVLNVLNHPYAQRLHPTEAARLHKKISSNKLFFPADADLKCEAPLQVVFEVTEGNTALLKYLVEVTKAIGTTFKQSAHPDALEQLYCESVFAAYTLLNRLISLSETQASGDATALFDVQGNTLLRLLRSLLQQKSIPFHGEPAEGMQILGLLETRCLDFDNVVLLSANEDFLPGTSHRASFIPYNLREAHGMTTLEKQVALSAYYFYRLLSRASNISLLYNVSTDGMASGEMSRFLSQLLAEVGAPAGKQRALLSPLTKPTFYTLTTKSESSETPAITVEKTDDVLQRLCDRFDATDKEKPRYLSPSAINTYLNCPLQFYFRYVVGLNEEDELSEEVDYRQFGTIFHECMERLYKPYKGRELTKHTLLQMAHDEVGIKNALSYAFAKVFFNIQDEAQRENYHLRLQGEQEINRMVLEKYVQNQLLFDAELAPIKILGLEETVTHVEMVNSGKRTVAIHLGGIIDRRDEIIMDGAPVQRILDYKTSQSKPTGTPTVSGLFDKSQEEMYKYVFQTFYYSFVVGKVLLRHREQLMPSLMYIKKASAIKGKTKGVNDADKVRQLYAENMSVSIRDGEGGDSFVVKDYFNDCADEFEKNLRALLQEIFSPEQPFEQTPCKKHCGYCEFLQICGRKIDKD